MINTFLSWKEILKDFSPVITFQSLGKTVFWGLAEEAAIVLSVVAVLDAAHGLCSAAIRTWQDTQWFVNKRSVHVFTEHGSKIQWGRLPAHSSWDWSEQHAGALLAYSQEQKELGILEGEEGTMISLEGDSRATLRTVTQRRARAINLHTFIHILSLWPELISN